MGSPLAVHRAGDAVWCTLDRPPLNLLEPGLIRALRETFEALATEGATRVAILTGGGRAFTAGMDVAVLRDLDVAGARALIAALHDAIEAVHRAPFPVIAAVNGPCLGAGFELALACDLRVAAEHATFGLTEVRWAIMPGAGGTQRLPRAVPLAKAMEMILMAETISAQEAYRIGLVNAVVPLAELMPAARRWAQTLCERGPLAVRAAKEAVIRGLSLPLPDGLRLEAFLSGTLRGTEDAVEGPRAFAEKRKPVFKAR